MRRSQAGCSPPPPRPQPTSSKPILSAVFLGAEMNRESRTGGCFTESEKAEATGVPGPHLLPAPSMPGVCPRTFTPATFLPRATQISAVTAQAVGASGPLIGQALVAQVSGFGHQDTIPAFLTPSLTPWEGCGICLLTLHAQSPAQSLVYSRHSIAA